MALSNIFNEPRREIVEQVIGTVTLGAILTAYGVADWYLAHCLMDTRPPVPGGKIIPALSADFIVGLLIGAMMLLVGTIAIAGLVVLAHELGEDICDFFQDRGVHLRPRERRR